MDIIQLISAAGVGGIIGSIVTTLIQSWLSEKSKIKTRNFEEKKEAYIGVLSAYQKSCLSNNKKEILEFALWVDRCELVANKDLIICLNKMKTADFSMQKAAFSEAKMLMKKDLGIEL